MERNIYAYHNGKELKKYDPMQVYTRLISKDVDLEGDFARLRVLSKMLEPKPRNPDEEPAKPPSQEMVNQCLDSYNKLLEAIRHAFRLEEYSGDDFGDRGTTDDQAFAMFADFGTWFANQKKSGVQPLTSLPSTEPISST